MHNKERGVNANIHNHKDAHTREMGEECLINYVYFQNLHRTILTIYAKVIFY